MRQDFVAARNGRATNALSRNPLGEPLLTPGEAARLLSVKTSWIYEAVRSRRLPHLKIGRHLRFLRSDLEAWVADQRVERRPL